MRRLHGGLLAAVVLLAGCSLGSSSDDVTAPVRIDPPPLALSTQALTSTRSPVGSLTVVVTSPEGAASPGLDAAVTVLMERPDVRVTVVVPGGADLTTAGGVETMSGYPAHVLDAAPDAVVAAAITQLGLRPDLVFVGITEGVAVGSGGAAAPVAAVLRSAASADVPAIAVTSGSVDGPDLATAGVMVRSLFDLELDRLLEPGARLLNVPTCVGGIVRGPVAVDVADVGPTSAVPDCRRPEPPVLDDDVAAHEAGFASIVELDA